MWGRRCAEGEGEVEVSREYWYSSSHSEEEKSEVEGVSRLEKRVFWKPLDGLGKLEWER